ncbi:MAG: hypothetical protein QF436_03615 [Candidatus Woesearchaeota archaeon]|jgi:hypothetical protein|nr:hypothetical protein [Candidatus Woesearchaeota archaeon]MDP7623175.1 hypothetical protein [Candidatus Woesearchaeota archaeon]HJN56760.1 hypothetical protein [Candidatus Woesearchaeota archaeon]|tara:strand:+ start:12239 stop:12625 length:387 start_codon:yes stop_codon:yes gene_type:complete
MKKNWKNEIARDSLAFGSILFYLIVIIRAIIGEYMPFVYQLLIALIILFLLSSIVKNTNQHIARAFILVVFTSLFYKDNLYTLFAALLWVFMIFSAVYIKIKKESIKKGIILGIFAMLISYYLSSFLG